ncbi:hypothetical protein SEA_CALLIEOMALLEY_3 [Arthrobacter phage CallieOMalley]|uniref:Uncharacterized protein n=1 Tax=Arthrobacter phage CallieOMalley TaxID=2488955 RepID=A0A3G8FSE8_9CAUD|nr:hypothetical protein SEA_CALLIEOMALLEY_3 [Arthrobacter phage CallieOMalley]
MDYRDMSDEQLDNHLNEVLNEKERRERIRNIPSQVAMLATQFREGGGNQTELVAAVGG